VPTVDETQQTSPLPAPTTFASIRIVTDDVARLADFYESVTGAVARRPTELFAEVVTPVATLAIAGTRTVELFGAGAAHGADNRSVIIEFRVEDVDREFTRLRGLGVEFVLEPTTQPWGNRSVLFRDPDGNLVNLFAPV
jgi:catechol 2,3-dioxygenase-like lactoylglutathione lyase family enzyme